MYSSCFYCHVCEILFSFYSTQRNCILSWPPGFWNQATKNFCVLLPLYNAPIADFFTVYRSEKKMFAYHKTGKKLSEIFPNSLSFELGLFDSFSIMDSVSSPSSRKESSESEGA
jgi:hypothetical protein